MHIVRHVLQATACAGLLFASCATDAQAHTAKEVILHSFTGPEGAAPLGGVIVVGNALYGTAYSGGEGRGTVFKIEGNTLSVLHKFVVSEGAFPQAGLTVAPNGGFYGTLSRGGYTGVSKAGYGGVFAMNAAGAVTVLHQFQGPEGAIPVSPVSIDAAGDLIGTTQYGGSGKGLYGTLYQVTPAGTTTVLANLSAGKCMGGIAPVTIQASGDVFGTTWMKIPGPTGCVWHYTPAGTFGVIHSFNDGAGGREPRGGVVFDKAGNQYGATYFRGNVAGGTLFKISPTGTYTVLHSFACAADGGYPEGSLLITASGMLYGTGSSCGTGGGGVVFSYDTVKNVYSVLYSFVITGGVDGDLPTGPLSIDASGNLYGTTEYGGPDNLGTVFEIQP